jgi:hypothetical protein
VYSDVTLRPAGGPLKESGSRLSAEVQVGLPAGGQVLWVLVGCKVYFCQDEDVCLFEEVYFKVPVDAERSAGESSIVLSHVLSPKAQTVAFPGLT